MILGYTDMERIRLKQQMEHRFNIASRLHFERVYGEGF